jgi:hypothetical protein
VALELLLGRKKRAPQFSIAGSSLLLLELDASVSETHEFSNAVTHFPIEDGSDITDHIKLDPDKITIEGFVTNSPIKNLIQMRDNPTISAGGLDRVTSAYETLLGISGRNGSNPPLVDIFTTLRIFTDMALVSLSIPRDGATGEALRFSAEFVHVRKVSLAQATIFYTSGKKYGAGGVEDDAQPTSSQGKQIPAEAPPNKDTLLKNLSQLLNKTLLK